MNITLIGMPGSGKSFVGKKLAEQLRFSFIDIDKVIERDFDLQLQQVVEELGREEFLDKEAQTIIENTDTLNDLVVSPGGSVVYRQEVMEHLKRISTVFYLKVSLEVLEKRIGNSLRGIVISKNQTLADLYIERTPLYEKFASYTLDGEMSPEIIVETIMATPDLDTSASSTKSR